MPFREANCRRREENSQARLRGSCDEIRVFFTSPVTWLVGASPDEGGIGHCARPQYDDPSKLDHFSLLAGGPIGLLLRASNEHILIVRVARAQETNGLTDSFNLPYLPPPNL